MAEASTAGSGRGGVGPRWGGLAAFGALLVGSAAVTLSFWPGHMDPDTLDELNDGITQPYTDWHTPILSAMHRVAWLAGLGSPGWVLAAGVLTLAVGVYLVLRVRLARPWAVVGALLCLVFPPVLGWDIHVGRDAWVAAFLICGFGLAARAWRTRGSARWTSFGAALACAFLAGASRQNSWPAVLILLCVLAALAVPRRPRARRWLVLAAGIAGTLALIGIQTGIEDALSVDHLDPQQGGYLYDLARMSVDEGKVLIPPSVFPSQSLAYIRSRTTTATVDPLFFGAGSEINIPVSPSQFAQLQHAWIAAITSDPEAYIRERGAATLELSMVTAPPNWITQWPQYDPGYRALIPPLNNAAMSYLLAFTIGNNNGQGGAIFTGWVYFALLAFAAGWFLRRRASSDRVLGLLALALLVYVAVICLAAPGVGYRYAYPGIAGAVALTAVLLGVAAFGIVGRGRSAITVPSPSGTVDGAPQPEASEPDRAIL